MDVHPVLHQPPSQPFSVLANSYIIIVDAMQASRALITMLVVVASAFAPVLSAPLECVVVPFISCYIVTADLFVVLVNSAKCTTVRNEDAVHFFLSLRRSGPVANVCMYCDSIVTELQQFFMTILEMCSTTFRYFHEFHLCVNCCFFFVDGQPLHMYLNFKPHGVWRLNFLPHIYGPRTKRPRAKRDWWDANLIWQSGEKLRTQDQYSHLN